MEFFSSNNAAANYAIIGGRRSLPPRELLESSSCGEVKYKPITTGSSIQAEVDATKLVVDEADALVWIYYSAIMSLIEVL